MIQFAPNITVLVGSVSAIVSSVICTLIFVLWYRNIKIENREMCAKIKKLTEEFTKLSNVLMGVEDENEPKTNDDIPIDLGSNAADDVSDRVRNPRVSHTIPEHFKRPDSREGKGNNREGEDNREVPNVYVHSDL